MKKRMMTWAVALLSIAALALVLYPLAGTLAQGNSGGSHGKPGGGGEETSGNNLSYPANFYGDSLQTGTIGDASLNLSGEISYGCAVEETDETATGGTITYPNTSCDGLLTSECESKCTYYDADGNQVQAPIEPIYVQKDPNNKWQAGYSWVTPSYDDEDGKAINPLKANYIDWGDNLESKSWPVQVIRIETNTFSTLDTENPDQVSPRLRYDMWHVRGQGTDELWGLHTTNATPPVPYVYLDSSENVNWPYAVNVTPAARLNISKLQTGSVTCPPTADVPHPAAFSDLTWVFDESKDHMVWKYKTADGALIPVPYDNDIPYTPELNIKGSYVYGYNWNLKSETVENAEKTGWWRLTFYTTDNSVDFKNVIALTPPPDLPYKPTTSSTAVEPAADTGPLYLPVADTDNQLTYIDICVAGGTGSGGRKGGGGGKGGGHGNH